MIFIWDIVALPVSKQEATRCKKMGFPSFVHRVYYSSDFDDVFLMNSLGKFLREICITWLKITYIYC